MGSYELKLLRCLPLQVAQLVGHGERLVAGLTLRSVQNRAGSEDSSALVRLLAGVVSSDPPPAESQLWDAEGAASGAFPMEQQAQEAFYGSLLHRKLGPGRFEGLLERVGVAVDSTPLPDRYSRLCFLADAVLHPLSKAAEYREAQVTAPPASLCMARKNLPSRSHSPRLPRPPPFPNPAP